MALHRKKVEKKERNVQRLRVVGLLKEIDGGGGEGGRRRRR